MINFQFQFYTYVNISIALWEDIDVFCWCSTSHHFSGLSFIGFCLNAHQAYCLMICWKTVGWVDDVCSILLPDVQWFFTVDWFFLLPCSGLMVFVDGKQKNRKSLDTFSAIFKRQRFEFARKEIPTRNMWFFRFAQHNKTNKSTWVMKYQATNTFCITCIFLWGLVIMSLLCLVDFNSFILYIFFFSAFDRSFDQCAATFVLSARKINTSSNFLGTTLLGTVQYPLFKGTFGSCGTWKWWFPSSESPFPWVDFQLNHVKLQLAPKKLPACFHGYPGG